MLNVSTKWNRAVVLDNDINVCCFADIVTTNGEKIPIDDSKLWAMAFASSSCKPRVDIKASATSLSVSALNEMRCVRLTIVDRSFSGLLLTKRNTVFCLQ